MPVFVIEIEVSEGFYPYPNLIIGEVLSRFSDDLDSSADLPEKPIILRDQNGDACGKAYVRI